MSIPHTEGEIPTEQLLLDQVELYDALVLADAQHTQRKLCQQEIDDGAAIR